MNIYSPRGTKVRWSYPSAGYEVNVKIGAIYLKRNAIYTVESTDVHDSYTDVYLQEVPGVAFNSVQFSSVRRRRSLPATPTKKSTGKQRLKMSKQTTGYKTSHQLARVGNAGSNLRC